MFQSASNGSFFREYDITLADGSHCTTLVPLESSVGYSLIGLPHSIQDGTLQELDGTHDHVEASNSPDIDNNTENSDERLLQNLHAGFVNIPNLPNKSLQPMQNSDNQLENNPGAQLVYLRPDLSMCYPTSSANVATPVTASMPLTSSPQPLEDISMVQHTAMSTMVQPSASTAQPPSVVKVRKFKVVPGVPLPAVLQPNHQFVNVSMTQPPATSMTQQPIAPKTQSPAIVPLPRVSPPNLGSASGSPKTYSYKQRFGTLQHRLTRTLIAPAVPLLQQPIAPKTQSPIIVPLPGVSPNLGSANGGPKSSSYMPSLAAVQPMLTKTQSSPAKSRIRKHIAPKTQSPAIVPMPGVPPPNLGSASCGPISHRYMHRVGARVTPIILSNTTRKLKTEINTISQNPERNISPKPTVPTVKRGTEANELLKMSLVKQSPSVHHYIPSIHLNVSLDSVAATNLLHNSPQRYSLSATSPNRLVSAISPCKKSEESKVELGVSNQQVLVQLKHGLALLERKNDNPQPNRFETVLTSPGNSPITTPIDKSDNPALHLYDEVPRFCHTPPSEEINEPSNQIFRQIQYLENSEFEQDQVEAEDVTIGVDPMYFLDTCDDVSAEECLSAEQEPESEIQSNETLFQLMKEYVAKNVNTALTVSNSNPSNSYPSSLETEELIKPNAGTVGLNKTTTQTQCSGRTTSVKAEEINKSFKPNNKIKEIEMSGVQLQFLKDDMMGDSYTLLNLLPNMHIAKNWKLEFVKNTESDRATPPIIDKKMNLLKKDDIIMPQVGLSPPLGSSSRVFSEKEVAESKLKNGVTMLSEMNNMVMPRVGFSPCAQKSVMKNNTDLPGLHKELTRILNEKHSSCPTENSTKKSTKHEWLSSPDINGKRAKLLKNGDASALQIDFSPCPAENSAKAIPQCSESTDLNSQFANQLEEDNSVVKQQVIATPNTNEIAVIDLTTPSSSRAPEIIDLSLDEKIPVQKNYLQLIIDDHNYSVPILKGTTETQLTPKKEKSDALLNLGITDPKLLGTCQVVLDKMTPFYSRKQTVNLRSISRRVLFLSTCNLPKISRKKCSCVPRRLAPHQCAPLLISAKCGRTTKSSASRDSSTSTRSKPLPKLKIKMNFTSKSWGWPRREKHTSLLKLLQSDKPPLKSLQSDTSPLNSLNDEAPMMESESPMEVMGAMQSPCHKMFIRSDIDAKIQLLRKQLDIQIAKLDGIPKS